MVINLPPKCFWIFCLTNLTPYLNTFHIMPLNKNQKCVFHNQLEMSKTWLLVWSRIFDWNGPSCNKNIWGRSTIFDWFQSTNWTPALMIRAADCEIRTTMKFALFLVWRFPLAELKKFYGRIKEHHNKGSNNKKLSR